MATGNRSVCESCGAEVVGDRCDLCGTPVRAKDRMPEVVEYHEPEVVEVVAKPVVENEGSVGETKTVCPTCGAANRADARFCDQCGERFVESVASSSKDAVAAPKTPSRPPKRKKKPEREAKTSETEQPRVGLYVSLAIAAVVVLYLISAYSGDSRQPAAPASSPPPAVVSGSNGDIDSYLPEDDELSQSSSETKAAIEGASDPSQRQALREELVASYASAGRLDLAGREQEKVAEEMNSAEAWALAGNMHFDWMEGQSGSERVKAAQRAARAYEKSLEIEPDNLDVRTDLGVAYLNDPSSPMLAIQNTNQVLQVDSNHVQANFNKGVMLAQIGRTEEAVRLFRKVVELSEPGEPAHERAVQVLSQLGASP